MEPTHEADRLSHTHAHIHIDTYTRTRTHAKDSANADNPFAREGAEDNTNAD